MRRTGIGLLTLALAAALAQQPEPQPPASDPEAAKPEQAKPEAAKPTPAPDAKAYTEALRIKEPDKKIEALEKWLADFPRSGTVSAARTQIVTAAADHYAKDRKALLAKFDQVSKGLSLREGTQLQSTFAGVLLRKEIFLEDARKIVKRALAATDYSRFAADFERTRKEANPNSSPPPPATIRSMHDSFRAGSLETVGSIELKLNRLRPARRAFLEALKVDPARVGAAVGLAAIAEKRNRPKEQLQYTAYARLARASVEQIDRFQTIYRKTHNDSMAGAEEYLDALYEEKFPPPVRVAAYKPAANRTSRTVLAEVHTGAGCPPCVAADLAFDALMARYSPKDLVVISYHQHIPRPDPMTNRDTQARWKFINGRGVPTFLIDGKSTIGGGGRSATASKLEQIEKLIAPRLETRAGAGLRIETGVAAGGIVEVKAVVSELNAESKELQLRVALVERVIRYSGENGIRFHPNVVRGVGSIPVTGAGTFDYSFDLVKVEADLAKHIQDFETKDERHNPDGKFRFMSYVHKIDPANLAVAAYLEDSKTQEVLQAAWAEVRPVDGPRMSRRDE